MTKPEEALEPRVLVMGLGGIGGIVSAHLYEQHVDITAVSTNHAIRETIERAGYWLSGDGETRIISGRAISEPPLDGRGFDFILLATQPPQVEVAARTAMPALADDGVMVCFQNGLCEERIAKLVGRERVIGAIVAWGASMIGPGRYQKTADGGFTIGRLDGAPDEKVEELGLLLESVGPVQVTDNLRGARWSKLAINCAISSLGAIGGDRLGNLLTHRFIRRLALEIMTEAVEVARAEKVKLVKIAGTIDLDKLALTPQEKAASGSASLVKKHALLLAVGARYRRLRSSMLSAIERGRKPSVDFLNGEIVSLGDKHNIRVPVNAMVQRTVHRIASGELRPSLDLLRRIYDDTRPAN
jgi:2-dehydropantoate 2-reductase